MNYFKLDDTDLETINKAAKVTTADYELLGNFFPVENLISVIEDLLLEVKRLNENTKI